jgi:hypothetical protein
VEPDVGRLASNPARANFTDFVRPHHATPSAALTFNACLAQNLVIRKRFGCLSIRHFLAVRCLAFDDGFWLRRIFANYLGIFSCSVLRRLQKSLILLDPILQTFWEPTVFVGFENGLQGRFILGSNPSFTYKTCFRWLDAVTVSVRFIQLNFIQKTSMEFGRAPDP